MSSVMTEEQRVQKYVRRIGYCIAVPALIGLSYTLGAWATFWIFMLVWANNMLMSSREPSA